MTTFAKASVVKMEDGRWEGQRAEGKGDFETGDFEKGEFVMMRLWEGQRVKEIRYLVFRKS
jgi:hypothetical protein